MNIVYHEDRNIKFVIVVSIIIIAFVSGCRSKFKVKEYSQPINIIRADKTGEGLTIEWIFTNTSNSDVWICENLKYYLRDSFFAYIQNDILYICIKCFDAPFVAPEIPVVSIYVKVPKGGDVKQCITIPFELKERATIDKKINLKKLNTIIIKIGVLEGMHEDMQNNLEINCISPFCDTEVVYSIVLKRV